MQINNRILETLKQAKIVKNKDDDDVEESAV